MAITRFRDVETETSVFSTFFFTTLIPAYLAQGGSDTSNHTIEAIVDRGLFL